MLSSDYETKVRVNKRELLDCIDRATLLIKEGDKKPIIIDIKDDAMQMMIKSQIGSMDEVILCTKDGKDLMIGFNPKFLIDALRVIDDEEVDLYFMNAKAPCFIKDEEQSYIYLNFCRLILMRQFRREKWNNLNFVKVMNLSNLDRY